MMKLAGLFERVTIAVFLVFASLTSIQAGTQPKFDIIPTVKAPAQLPVNGIAQAQYRVTNNTLITRTLTMIPITGVTQLTSGVGVCPYPFTLAHGQSCLLNLQLSGSDLRTRTRGGPVICKTNSATNPTADLFLCSQPSEDNQLDVTGVPAELASITVAPSVLFFGANSFGTVTVTNNATTIDAQNITAQIPVGSPLSVSSTTCGSSLAPGSSCTITFTSPVVTAATTIPISGSNTTMSSVNVTVVLITITATPTTLHFTSGSTAPVTVTNVSSGSALNITATLPGGGFIFVSSSTCPSSLAPGASCTITFGSSAPDMTTATIAGTNTNQVMIDIQSADVILTIAPNPLVFQAGDSPGVPVFVTNTSATTTATNVVAHIPTGSAIFITGLGTCGLTFNLAPLDSCTITFVAGIPGTTLVPIFGDNTDTRILTIQATSGPVLRVGASKIIIPVEKGPVVLTVTNTSNSTTITNVHAALPADWTDVVQDSSACTTLPPNTSCDLSFSSLTSHRAQNNVVVSGDNSAVSLPTVMIAFD